jgi:hypothetical protein
MLPEDKHEQILALREQGDHHADVGDYGAALQAYWEAWDLLPEPGTQWEAATWLLAAMEVGWYGRGGVVIRL